MEYKILRSSRKTLSLEIKDCQIIVRAPRLVGKYRIEAFVQSKTGWISKTLKKQEEQRKRAEEMVTFFHDGVLDSLREKAKAQLPPKVEHFADLMGVKYGRITVRRQKTRWGSCSSKGNLNFNCLLMLCPDFVVDYVVVHELCHLKQMNHSERFWAEVERVLPQYKEARKWLKENGRIITIK